MYVACTAADGESHGYGRKHKGSDDGERDEEGSGVAFETDYPVDGGHVKLYASESLSGRMDGKLCEETCADSVCVVLSFFANALLVWCKRRRQWRWR